jgi:hypothetical protein
MSPRRIGVGLSLALIGIGLSLAVVTTVSGASQPPALAPADLPNLGITSASDVTDALAGDVQQTPVDRAGAIAAAEDEVGKTDPNVRVLQGRALVSPKEPDRQVWIVLFAGGVSPFDGPAGGNMGPITFSVTGVIIDAQTGEFIRGFMH